MSITKIFSTRLHWSSYSWNEKIVSCMSRNRWEEIKSKLHFIDNSTINKSNKLAKVSLLIDHLRLQFEKIPMTEHLCVDEQMIPFKGASSIKQYIPKKPYKWGYKMFLLCDHKGMVYDFIPYTGKISPVDDPAIPDLGPSSNSVLHLAECIPAGKNYRIYFDDWFTSIKLIEHLATRQIWACGTVQERRLPCLTCKTDKKLQESGRGSFDEFETKTDVTTICAVKCYDN